MSFSKRLLSGDAPALVPGENFKVVTYTGNGGTQAITGVGFKPDFVWCKRRNEGSDHNLTDSTRGIKTGLNINSNAQEGNQDPLGVTVFGDDGFTVSDNDGGGASVNGTNDTYVAWCWKAAGGATSNSDGSTTSTVNANKAAGFSIVTYTGTGSNASVGHGLGAPAKFIMIKKRSGASDWTAFTAIDNTKYLEPNGTPPFRTSNVWQNTDPTSSVFTLTTGGDSNGGSATYVAYCFADVEGYQKFGSYDGNGSTNGPVVNVGFEPAYVMVKNVDSTDNWLILDNKRNTANPRNNLLQMNLSNAESTEVGAQMNFYSNGFQSVGTGGGAGSGQINSNGDKYLYWAIAATAAETAEVKAANEALKASPVPSTTAQLRKDKEDDTFFATKSAISRSRDIQKESEDTGKSIAEIGRESAPSTEPQSDDDKAAEEAGATRGVGGQRGMNKGGLMKKKKK